jgi:Ca2+-binding EF-hand superfamily protein
MWGGGSSWKRDKTSFKNFCLQAVNGSAACPERRELYSFLAECFLDADCDRDGRVGIDEFDFLIERAASLPRRFGLAPSWSECYGDVAQRAVARREMFHQMDKSHRGSIGLHEWVDFAIAHIGKKVLNLKLERVDFSALENSTAEEFMTFLHLAFHNRHSEKFKNLYEHLFKIFTEQDAIAKGSVSFEEFDQLIEEAARVPRTLQLAPQAHEAYQSSIQRQLARRKLFDSMDKDKSGTITFDEFLHWAMNHMASKIQSFRGRSVRAPLVSWD